MKKLTNMLQRDNRKNLNRSAVNLESQDLIMNMTPNVKQVFKKISAQLEDSAHPIGRIIRTFRRHFIKDTKEQYDGLAPLVSRKISLKKRTIAGNEEIIEFEDDDDEQYAINYERVRSMKDSGYIRRGQDSLSPPNN